MSLEKLSRNKSILRDYLKGLKTSFIARKHKLSDRRIRAIIREYKKAWHYYADSVSSSYE